MVPFPQPKKSSVAKVQNPIIQAGQAITKLDTNAEVNVFNTSVITTQ